MNVPMLIAPLPISGLLPLAGLSPFVIFPLMLLQILMPSVIFAIIPLVDGCIVMILSMQRYNRCQQTNA
jgi:hypothetical protein